MPVQVGASQVVTWDGFQVGGALEDRHVTTRPIDIQLGGNLI